MSNTTNDLISIGELISEASKKGVDFGKGDPYNRLRYYTKIGLLPHMTRKTINGEMIGHYPTHALDLLIEIEKLKALGLSNHEVSSRLKNILNTEKESVRKKTLKTLRLITPSPKLLRVLLFIVFCTLVAGALGVLPIGKTRSDLIQKTIEIDRKYIIDSGTTTIPRNQSKVYIKTNNIRENSRVNVTFTQDYSPASRYWVGQKIPLEGFYLELDAPVSNDAEFNWWISN